jgi:hypothetical protein
VFLSTDTGTNWTQVINGLTNLTVLSLAVSGTNLFAGTEGDGIFMSTDSGSNWVAMNTGLANKDVKSLAISGTTLFAGTYGSSVWQRPLAEFVTGVEEYAVDNAFIVYPNPATDNFTIHLNAAMKNAELTVYNVLGEMVYAKSIEEQTTHIDLKSPSGIYFMKLSADKKQYNQSLIIQ